MTTALPSVAGLVAVAAVLLWWAILFRRGQLRIRFMAACLTAAVFAALCYVDVFMLGRTLGDSLALQPLATKSAIALAMGATILFWWPILGKSLRRIGIMW